MSAGRDGGRITPRQSAVLDLVARGYANKQIAGELAISEGAVKKHVSHLLSEFRAPNRTALVLVAVGQGLTPSGVDLIDSIGRSGPHGPPIALEDRGDDDRDRDEERRRGLARDGA